MTQIIYSTTYISPLGEILLASDSKNLVGLWFKGQKYFAYKLLDKLIEKNDLSIFNFTKKWLDSYFNGSKPSISSLALKPFGTNFNKSVWNLLCKIPYGSIVTYKYIAKLLAKQMHKQTMSCQATGNSIAHNPISIIIPCHRVVGSNGSLTGYASGISTKIKLLELEKVDMSNLFVPTPIKTNT